MIKWGGKNWRPGSPAKRQPINQSIEELMKPLGEKLHKGNVWQVVMNVPEQTSAPDITPSPTPTLTNTPTPTIGTITISLTGEYSRGSINANYIASSNNPTNVDVNISFVDTLGTISGSPIVISGSVTILSGQTNGSSYYTIGDDYNLLNDTSVFSSVIVSYSGSTSSTFVVNTTSEFNVTPTPTPSVTATQTGTPTQTPTKTPTPTPSSTPPTPGVAQANTYLSAVVAAGGTVTSPMSAATVTLFTSLFSNNIWNSLTAFYPILGGVQNSHAINGKNPGTNNLVFSGGWTHNASGMTGNGTTGFANTGINDNTLGLTRHISIYSRTNSISGAVDMGCYAPSTYGTYLQLRFNDGSAVGTKLVLGIFPSQFREIGQTDSSGFFIGTKPSTKQIYQNGVLKYNGGNTTDGYANFPIYIAAQNYNGTAGSFSSRQYCFTSVGTDISSVAITFSTIINTYQTALSRNTY
jgi:hypothetical protein